MTIVHLAEAGAGGMRRIPRDEWIGLANYSVWRILKALEDSKPHGVRELSGTNPSTTIRYLRLMTQWGLVQYRWGFRKKLYSITPLGRRLLECYDQIGEIVKTIRGRKGRGSDIEGVTTASGQGRGATPGQPLPRRT